MSKQYILAIDQGTTSSRAIIFGSDTRIITTAQQEFPQTYPQDGWVEHDPFDLWTSTLTVCKQALRQSQLSANDIAGIGITNQRETTVIWDRQTGQPVYNAIVWQDRRTSAYCNQLKQAGYEALVNQKTGLLLDPYFSATKINWILDNVDGARGRAERGELAFGTVDSWLLWQLTDGQVHATDATNASRTMLFNLEQQQWDQELLELFQIPESLLPEVNDCSCLFGNSSAHLLGSEIPITGIAGDQQAALIGQACFEPGMVKSTYGTGCFLMMNTGEQPVYSKNRLLTTLAYRINGKAVFALEGSIFMAGATIQWLRDGLKLISDASESEPFAKDSDPESNVIMVPAFTGLGAPYWDAEARGAILGLTRDTGIAEICKSALDSVCFQTKDLILAMQQDLSQTLAEVRVDGGMVNNQWLVQRLADILGAPVVRPVQTETTALGAAFLAGLQVNLFDSQQEFSKNWLVDRHFDPQLDVQRQNKLYNRWLDAVSRVRSE